MYSMQICAMSNDVEPHRSMKSCERPAVNRWERHIWGADLATDFAEGYKDSQCFTPEESYILLECGLQLIILVCFRDNRNMTLFNITSTARDNVISE